MLDSFASALATFVRQNPILAAIVLLVFALDAIEWGFGRFVTFTHKMRLHWRRLKSHPDPQAVHN